jgi:hypothetical protein
MISIRFPKDLTRWRFVASSSSSKAEAAQRRSKRTSQALDGVEVCRRSSAAGYSAV